MSRLKLAGGTAPASAVASFLLATVAFLYLSLFIWPCVPIFLQEDLQIYLVNAARMLEGQVIYRDFFQLTPPGTELVFLALFKLFGLRAWIPHVVLLGLGLGFAWLSAELSRKVIGGWSALLPGALFLTLAYRIWFIGSAHNWYSTLAVMAAVAVIIEKRTLARLALAGALCGLAAFFTQTRGLAAVLGFAVFLLWERRRTARRWRELMRSEAYLLASFLLSVVATDAYFVREVGLERFLSCTVVFVLRYFPADSMYNTFQAYTADLPEFLFSESWTTEHLAALAMWVFMHALLPFVYVAFFMRYRRDARAPSQEPWDRLMLLSITGLFLFAGVAPAPSWFRLCSVSLPALILLVWLAGSAGRFRAALLRTLALIALVLAIAEPIETQTSWRGSLKLPTGPTAFLDRDLYEMFQWLLQHTRPSEFFFRAVHPEYYFALGLRNPAAVDHVTPTAYTRPEQVRDVIEALERHRVRFVLWSVWLDAPPDYRPEFDPLGPLRAYVLSHYHAIKTFDNSDFEQVWERNR